MLTTPTVCGTVSYHFKNEWEGTMKKIICFIVALLMGGTLMTQDKPSQGETITFKLGIHYINSPSGKRFRDGIKEAITNYSKEFSRQGMFEPLDFPYVNEKEGLKSLVSLMEIDETRENKGRKVDIILGPTDSGVFVRALEQRKILGRAKIPVISSQVAAKVPYQKGGWFFRTNINVERRAQVIHDYLNKYWIRSIAVLYDNNEFGRRAEEAFQNELRGTQRENYLPLPYESSYDAREQIRQILQLRPEAVGIFGDRSDFTHLYSLMKSLNFASSPYLPLTFSIIDTRVLQDSLDDEDVIHFVSVTDVTIDTDFDDVRALAYDTTMLVLSELDALTQSETFNYQSDAWREFFRNRFEAILSGTITVRKINGKSSSKTRLSFNDYENATRPKVFELRKKEIEAIDLRETVTLPEKFGHKVDLTVNRFGSSAIFNFGLIIFVVLWMSIRDIKRWFSGSFLRLFNPFFLLLFLTNIVIALGVYLYLGETGSIRYDSVLTALILSLTPSTVLRLTLFETPTGKSIGLAKHYENYLQWIHARLTISSYQKQTPYINVLAYHNSVYAMKSLVKEIYLNDPNREQRIRMQAKLETVLKEADTWIGRRKALARFLFQTVGWERLVKYNFVPKKFAGYKPGSKKILEDPENVVLEAARICAKDPLKKILIEEKINVELKELAPERRQELEEDAEKAKNEMKTATALMRKRITFLFLLDGYDPDFDKKICCTGEYKAILDDSVKYCINHQQRMATVEGKVKELKKKLLAGKEGEQKEEYKKIFHDELGNLKSDPTCLKRAIGFLFGFNGCDKSYLIDNKLLPGNEAEESK